MRQMEWSRDCFNSPRGERMSRVIVSALILVVSLWAMRAYRMSDRGAQTTGETEVADLTREESRGRGSRGPASVPQAHVVGMDSSMNREVAAEVSKPFKREAATVADPNVAIAIADLGQAFPTRQFSVEDVRSMQREADRAEKEGLIQGSDRASYIRSLAQLRVEQMDMETEMMADDMYDLPADGGGFVEEEP